jgi:hypothetical protein
MDLASIWNLDPVQAVELREEGVRVLFDVVVVVFEDLAEELRFAVVHGLDDVFVVAGEVEEAAALAGRAELGDDVFGCLWT